PKLQQVCAVKPAAPARDANRFRPALRFPRQKLALCGLFVKFRRPLCMWPPYRVSISLRSLGDDMVRVYSLAFGSVLLAAIAAPALGQEQAPAPQPAASQQGVISYTPADFASARPNTALDMINRLPGFTLIAGDQVRGFAGAAGNVLIDGQRPTSKTDNLQDILARVTID